MNSGYDNGMTGVNIRSEIIRLTIDELELYRKDTPYDFVCRKCFGTVKIQRSVQPNAFALRAEAHCFLCGQRYIFSDINTYEERLMKGELPSPEDTRSRFEKIREREKKNAGDL